MVQNTFRLPEKEQELVLPPRGAAPTDPIDSRPVSGYKTYYYTGGQAQIYYEDVFLDEVSSLQFTTATNKTPIYGYSSVYFDTVAKGNLLVQGNFVVNFVNANYLQIVAKSIEDQRTKSNPNAEFEGGALLFRDPGIALDPKSFRNTKNINSFMLRQTINQIRGLGNKEFLELAQKVEADRRAGNSSGGEKFYNLAPFTIYAVFGDETDSQANHTVRTIKDVYLTGVAQVVNSSGETVQEQYSFIARDIGDIE